VGPTCKRVRWLRLVDWVSAKARKRGEMGEREMCPWAISNCLVIRCSTHFYGLTS
jgi:hypothetical protein